MSDAIREVDVVEDRVDAAGSDVAGLSLVVGGGVGSGAHGACWSRGALRGVVRE